MAQLVPVDTFDLIIIGGSGDLALRKLLPALYHRNCDQQITAESRIIAVSRAEMTRDEYVDSVRAALLSSLGSIDEIKFSNFANRLNYLQARLTKSNSAILLTDLITCTSMYSIFLAGLRCLSC